MLRKLSLVAVAAASLGAAALAPTSASAWGGWQVAGTAAGITAGAGAVRASSSAARPITATVMAAAMCGAWSRRRGVRAGAWSTAATERDRSIPRHRSPGPSRRGFFAMQTEPRAGLHAIFT